jgi:nucleotide-binding universal stress UspA family protein
MYRTIIVGCDGSAHGLAAARFAAALARRFDANLVVASAYVHTPHVRMDGSALEGLARSEAEQFARQALASVDSGPRARAAIVSGATPAGALHELAEGEGADLLVVGTSERRRIAGTQPGSVTEHVLHHSPCSVVVVPPSGEEPAFRQIGIAMDQGAPARAALATAVALAKGLGDSVAELVLLHANVPEPMFVRPGMELPWATTAETPGWLRDLADATEAPVPIRTVTEAGGLPGVLASGAAEVDLLVMGSRDLSTVRRLVLGSVSTQVVRHAPCPVLVVFERAAARIGDAGATEVTA